MIKIIKNFSFLIKNLYFLIKHGQTMFMMLMTAGLHFCSILFQISELKPLMFITPDGVLIAISVLTGSCNYNYFGVVF